jgi:hypothetical protein
MSKVRAGVAECILAANYSKDLEDLTITNKLDRLVHRAALNENVIRNSVHISLNFAASETLSPDRLNDIAQAYMQKIGFGEQPYLVYQHHDAGHPHLHIVSVKVRENGSRIDMHNIGRNQSEKARKEIEQSFGLVKASAKNQKVAYEATPISVQLVNYGQKETKMAIAQVLDSVLKTYHYTSLPELNVVLRQYNVVADPGSEKSRIHQHHGLTYSVLAANGKKIGVPIKASDFPNKPTFKYLERKFRVNEELRQPHKTRVKNAIDLALLKPTGHSLQSLTAALEKEGIYTFRRENAAGMVYGLTYVDHTTKCVFNGSDLGKPYSAKGLQERCRPQEINQSIVGLKKPMAVYKPLRQDSLSLHKPLAETVNHHDQPALANSSLSSGAGKVLDLLLQPEPTLDYIPGELKRQSRKKKRIRFTGH